MKRLGKNEKAGLWKGVNDLYTSEIITDRKQVISFIKKIYKQTCKYKDVKLRFKFAKNKRLQYFNRQTINEVIGHHQYIHTIPKECKWSDVSHFMSHYMAETNTGNGGHTAYQYILERRCAELGYGKYWKANQEEAI